MQGLAASHDLLVTQNWKGASLADLLRDQLGVFANSDGPAISLSGPEIFLNPQTTESIGLASHELATNAVKHGSLSVPSGKVAVSWAIEPPSGETPERLRLTSVERGGPAVAEPLRKGFGHVVFDRIVARALDGDIKMSFEPEGLTWQLTIPTVNSAKRRTVFKDRASWEDAE